MSVRTPIPRPRTLDAETGGTSPLLSIRLPRRMADRLDRAVKARGTSRSEVMRDALAAYLSEWEQRESAPTG